MLRTRLYATSNRPTEKRGCASQLWCFHSQTYLDPRTNMIYILIRHFRLHRFLLLTVGLWPYQQSKLVQLQKILLFSILMSFSIFQLTPLMTAKYTLGYTMKILSSALLFITFVIKYISFWINNQFIKYSLEQLQYICNQLKDENEVFIFEKYGYYAQCYTAKLILFSTCVFIGISIQIWQYIFPTSSPLKKFPPRRSIWFEVEYFVDQEKYFNIILLHMIIAFCVGVIAMTGTGAILITCFKYACGMFRIASYRIEQTMISHRKTMTSENASTIYKNMTYAVDIHCKAMKFSELLISNFERTFFFLIVFGVACLSINLFQIFQFTSFADYTEQLLLHLSFAVICLAYMFLANYVGQEITDYNNRVFLTVYNVQWYTAPLRIQRFILFLLQRSRKSFGLSVNGLFVASLECFATLVSASMSYFTVMYSMQK